jgi:hypothetical protein
MGGQPQERVFGVTAPDAADMFATPYDRIVPGVEVLATGISNLPAGDAHLRAWGDHRCAGVRTPRASDSAACPDLGLMRH